MAWTDFPCKEWTGYRRNGYGRASRDGRLVSIHRWTWEQQHGPLPRSVFVLHRCDNPPCYEIEHLFLGTQFDNMRDMAAKRRSNSQKKTHCPKGHEYNEANTRIYRGRRHCRQCDRDRRSPPKET